MKTLLFILLLILVGCSHQNISRNKDLNEIWVFEYTDKKGDNPAYHVLKTYEPIDSTHKNILKGILYEESAVDMFKSYPHLFRLKLIDTFGIKH